MYHKVHVVCPRLKDGPRQVLKRIFDWAREERGSNVTFLLEVEEWFAPQGRWRARFLRMSDVFLSIRNGGGTTAPDGPGFDGEKTLASNSNNNSPNAWWDDYHSPSHFPLTDKGVKRLCDILPDYRLQTPGALLGTVVLRLSSSKGPWATVVLPAALPDFDPNEAVDWRNKQLGPSKAKHRHIDPTAYALNRFMQVGFMEALVAGNAARLLLHAPPLEAVSPPEWGVGVEVKVCRESLVVPDDGE
jgi:hypothetical protein